MADANQIDLSVCKVVVIVLFPHGRNAVHRPSGILERIDSVGVGKGFQGISV